MASGVEHEKGTKLFSLIFAFGISIFSNPVLGLYGGLAFLIGGLWLSPDLDTKSNALKRWGFLKLIWMPYCKLIRHRSFLSHSPFIGTIIRLSYLIIWTTIGLTLISALGTPSGFEVAKFASALINHNPQQTLIILLGIEASSWLHLIQDGGNFRIK